MSYFTDSDDVYATLGRMISEAVSDEELGPMFQRSDAITSLVYTNPDAVITLELREDHPTRVEFGASELAPDVTLTMDADIGHRFWLGEISVGVALARGEIKASGPVDKILRLVPTATRAFPRYRRLLVEQGRGADIPTAGATAA